MIVYDNNLEFDEVIRKRKMIRQYDAERQFPNEIVKTQNMQALFPEMI